MGLGGSQLVHRKVAHDQKYGLSFDCQYLTKVGINGSGKHPSLSRYGFTLVGSSFDCCIRLRWELLVVANTLAYHDTAKITTVISFIVQAPRCQRWLDSNPRTYDPESIGLPLCCSLVIWTWIIDVCDWSLSPNGEFWHHRANPIKHFTAVIFEIS